MFQVTFQNHVTEIEDYLDIYLKNKSRDCILYSEDGGEFKIHKELFGQTNFLRKILATVNDQCCGIMQGLLDLVVLESWKFFVLVQKMN